VTFSNPAANAAASARSYVQALLEVLGDRQPLDVLPELMPWLDARLRGAPQQALRRPEAPGKWSVTQVVQHLADSELVLGFRSRMILSENRPALQGYDQLPAIGYQLSAIRGPGKISNPRHAPLIADN